MFASGTCTASLRAGRIPACVIFIIRRAWLRRMGCRWSGSAIGWVPRVLNACMVPISCVPSVLARPARGYRHFYFGGAPGVADRLAAALVAANPGLNVVGTLCPPFRPLTPEEDAEVVAQINAAAPDIVWVGLSTPKQEYWMASHIGLINASVLIGVGAAFDFLAGTKRQAPVLDAAERA